MSVRSGTVPTFPCKGEVDREAVGRGSRFSRTRTMTARAKNLRGNMTDAEARLWRALRRDQLKGLHFRRQHPIGPFTLDFYCPSPRLAIEVDGGQHAERRRQADERRTRWLAEKDLGNLPGVLADLNAQVERRKSRLTPSPALPLSGGGRAPIAAPGRSAP